MRSAAIGSGFPTLDGTVEPVPAVPGGSGTDDGCGNRFRGFSIPRGTGTETTLPVWMPPRAACHAACRWLDLAAGLVGLGYAVLPIGEEKRPMVKWLPYEVSRPTWRELFNEWRPLWSRAHGIALIAGRPHGLVIVDADTEESWAWCLANLPAVRGVRTRRGGHLHFRHPARGIIGNRSGEKAVTLEPGLKADVKGLAGYAVGPYSRHPKGHIYTPLGDWTRPVTELPELPAVIVRHAEDRPLPVRPPIRRRPGSEPEKALEGYIAKRGGVPPERSGSDDFVFEAAAWCKTAGNARGLTEAAFVQVIRHHRPEFAEGWIAAKWGSARGSGT